MKQAEDEPDAGVILSGFAQHSRAAQARVSALMEVLESAVGLDPDIKALSDDLKAQRLRGMRRLAQMLTKREALRGDLTAAEAADVLWLFGDLRMYTRLVVQRGRSPDRFEQWLASSLVDLLIAPDYRPRKRPARRSQ